jgi:hypothetical protein
MKDAGNRSKYNIILVDAIHPPKRARDYLDRNTFENELKQVQKIAGSS